VSKGRPWIAAIVAAALTACSGTRSSAVARFPGAERYEGPVSVSATFVPAGAIEVGMVEVSSEEGLERAVTAFADRTAEVGGDHGVVEHESTTFEMRTGSQTYTYSCGRSMCTGVRSYQYEVGILHLFGRAFRTSGAR
jgi:hypothetical protein